MIRFTATLFLMLANLMWLAHAVVPHHHHGNHICFVTQGGHENHTHEHSSNDPTDCCSLKQTIATQPGSDKRIENQDNDQGKNPQHLVFAYYIDCTSLFSISWVTPDVLGHPPQVSPRTLLTFTAHGLRAPPFC